MEETEEARETEETREDEDELFELEDEELFEEDFTTEETEDSEDAEEVDDAGTHIPPQSAPPFAGSHESLGSSTHVSPSAHWNAAMPPQNFLELSDDEDDGSIDVTPCTRMIMPPASTVGRTAPNTSTFIFSNVFKSIVSLSSKINRPSLSINLWLPCMKIEEPAGCNVP